jgi:hypothetical protein
MRAGLPLSERIPQRADHTLVAGGHHSIRKELGGLVA